MQTGLTISSPTPTQPTLWTAAIKPLERPCSYATKYALLKTFNIETGEDEESRYQQEEYDFAAALTRAEAASKELAREILKEAKQKAVILKDAAAIKAVDAVGKKLATKFAKETEGA